MSFGPTAGSENPPYLLTVNRQSLSSDALSIH